MLDCGVIGAVYVASQIYFPPMNSILFVGPPAGMNRMNPPRGPSIGPLPGTYGPGLRGPPPNNSLGPGGPMPPMTMTGPAGRPQWQPNTSTVSIYT